MTMNLRALMPFGSGNGGTRTQPPAHLFGSLHREVDRLFEDFTGNALGPFGKAQVNLVPSIDVSETDKEIVITAEMPGLERKDIDISLADDVLTIRGEKKIEKQEGDEKNRNYHVAERGYGVFLRG